MQKEKTFITNWKCRCSGIHKIMANSRSNPQLTEKQAVRLKELESKESLTERQRTEFGDLLARKENIGKVFLSDSCISYLSEVYAWEKWGMIPFPKEFYEIEQLKKGKMAEEDSITLLSVVDGVLYSKNDERICNDFLSGEPDIFLGDNIMSADKIIDIKTSFDMPSFLKKLYEDLNKAYELQIQGYMDITGAQEGELAYCLVDMPEIMILDFKKKLFYKMDVATEENIEFKEAWEMMENSMRFKNIPVHQRVFRQKVEPFTEADRQSVYDRVKLCREWLFNFDEQMENLNLPVVESEISQ